MFKVEYYIILSRIFIRRNLQSLETIACCFTPYAVQMSRLCKIPVSTSVLFIEHVVTWTKILFSLFSNISLNTKWIKINIGFEGTIKKKIKEESYFFKKYTSNISRPTKDVKRQSMLESMGVYIFIMGLLNNNPLNPFALLPQQYVTLSWIYIVFYYGAYTVVK